MYTIYSLKRKIRTTSDPNDPKDPRNGVFVEGCFKDFRDFKKNPDDYLNILNRQISMDESELENYISNHDVIKMRRMEILQRQKNILMMVKKLINEGREDHAIREFLSGFPTCLPYRSRNSYLRTR